MKTAIIIHGCPEEKEYFDVSTPSPSNFQWLPWLQKQLLMKGILAQTPEMPVAYNPSYENWKKTFEQFDVDEETMLVGHSCGGGFLVRWLSENKIKVGKVVLVAPWLDPERELNTGMFDFEIDKDFPQRTGKTVIMYSTDDMSHILESISILKSKVTGAEFQEFTDKGHFVLEDLKSVELPEVLNNLI